MSIVITKSNPNIPAITTNNVVIINFINVCDFVNKLLI
jgi:hypothetical protein